MNSPCKNSDSSMSSVEAVSIAIDNLSLLTISSNEPSCPSKNEVQMVEQVLQSDLNCNEIYANNCSLNTRNATRMTIPEDFNPTEDCGLSCGSTSVVPLDMRLALRDSIHDKVKIDYVIRQNDHTNAQQNSPIMLRSNSLDCVITLYDSESEDSDFTLDSDDYSTDENTESEFRESFRAQKLSSSSDESLHSDGESVESSEDFSSDSDEDSTDSGGDSSSDSDEDSSDLDEEPCDSEPSDDEPDVSDEDSAATSGDEKPDSTDDEDSEEDDGSVHDNGPDVHVDEEESSDDDKSIDLDDSSDSQSESSDSE